MGSTFAARRAGSQQAAAAPPVTSKATIPMVAGSAVFRGGPTSYATNISAIRHAASLARGEAA